MDGDVTEYAEANLFRCNCMDNSERSDPYYHAQTCGYRAWYKRNITPYMPHDTEDEILDGVRQLICYTCRDAVRNPSPQQVTDWNNKHPKEIT